MADLLSKYAKVKVSEITDGVMLEPDHVYIIPPDKYVELDGERLRLSPPADPRGSRMTIDVFFRSLAKQRERRAIGVVLSGTGSDGTVGLRAIKAAGGLAIAQHPDSAAHVGMPRSVIDQGLADKILSPQEMPKVISDFAAHPYVANGVAGESKTSNEEKRPESIDGTPLETIVDLLSKESGIDLGYYKESTLSRRIARRMGLNQIDSIEEYAEFLDEHKLEVDQLARDLHISVTDFFRDEEAYDVLKEHVVPRLFEQALKREDDGLRAIRVWTPGCATGEEAFSLSILLHEEKERNKANRGVNIQVFATDIDDEAVKAARRGTYPIGSLSALPHELREKYFSPVEKTSRFRIKQYIRDTVSFARHDILGDPPFSRLDLVSCRNLLIYLRREAQKPALDLFHFALREGGFLFLGPSETLGASKDAFRVIDKKWRIYQRLDGVQRRRPELPATTRFESGRQKIEQLNAGEPRHFGGDLARAAAHRLLAQVCVPPTVVVNKHFNVLHLQGDLVEFLDLPNDSGELTLTDMLREPLRTRVRAGMYRAARENQFVQAQIQIPARNDESLEVNLTIRPANSRELGDDLLVISFDAERIDKVVDPDRVETKQDSVSNELERELHATRADLRATVEELENANEELRSSNEEAMTMNEELQSTNEELETQSEELRSVNEELTTVNSQLREKMDELQDTHSDIANLLTSTKLPAVFLDESFCIRRFTPEAQKLLHVIESDIGRPIDHLRGQCVDDLLLEDARSVMEGLAPIERELQTADGKWYIRNTLPYRTDDNRIVGVVITYLDVTGLKRTTNELQRRERQQAELTNLSQRVLRGVDSEVFLDSAVRIVADALDCEYAKILKLLPGKNELLMVAGVGWNDGLVGTATVPTSAGSQAGYTLEQSMPVIVENLPEETRFSGPDLLLHHRVHSGISVVISGKAGEPYGVFGVHTKDTHTFTQQDVEFVQSVANVIGGIIQRDAIENQLRANEERFRTLADNISQLAWMAEPDGYITWYNQRWFDYTGTTLDEMQGWGWQQVHDPDYVEKVTEKFKACIQSGEAWEDTFPLKSKDGDYRWFLSRAYPIRNNNGDIVRWFGTNTDITERRNIEREIDEQRDRLQALLDNSPASIYAKDRDGRFILINAAHAGLLGETPEEILGKSDEDFSAANTAAAPRQNNEEQIWESKAPKEFEEYLVVNGQDRIFNTNKFPLRTADGEMYAVCTIAIDISQRKEQEEQLRLVMAELNHRVKNSLATVEAIAVQTSANATDVDSFMASFRNRVRSMAAAHSLLTQQEWKGIALREILSSELEPRVSDLEKLKLDGEDIVIPPDQSLALHLAVHELATNAGKYGSLSITSGGVAVSWQRVSSAEGELIQIDWREFDGPAVSVATNLGFGTKLIDDVVEYDLGGTVERDWHRDGFRCTMSFPIKGAVPSLRRNHKEDGAEPNEQAPAPKAPGKPKVLLVEDVMSLARLMTLFVEETGCEVIGPAPTLEKGLALADAAHLDAAILDVSLRGKKVYPLAQKLAEQGVPFALTTGYEKENLPPDLSPERIFVKPIEFDVVKQWLLETVAAG